MRTTACRLAAVSAMALVLAGCSALTGPKQFGAPGEALERAGDEIVVCGQLYHTGTPVVLWMDPGGYDAYRVECKFDPDSRLPTAVKNPTPNRYHTFRKQLPEDVREDVRLHGWRLEDLQEYVDLFVIHYDVCGTSRKCFEVLQDRRGLSVHFMLDLDGTIYQTLDLKERAWHAGTANDRSVGIEIANMGAYPNMEVLDRWYFEDEDGQTFIQLPESYGDGGIQTPNFVARPARNEPVVGNIQGKDLMQYDLTDAQYEALVKLTATLCKVLPRIEPDYPRDEAGNLRTTTLSEEEMESFSGLLGHYHVAGYKVDPGPAFDWDRLRAGVLREMR